MKISFIEPHLQLFGGIRRIIGLANRLIQRGHEVTVFHSDGSPCEWMKCEARIKSHQEVLKEMHEVIIYNDPNPTDYSLVRKAKARLKVFYVLELYTISLLRGFKPQLYFPRYRRTFFVKESLRSPYLKLANSTWLVRWLKEEMNIESLLLIGGLNTEVFHPVEMKETKNEIRILSSGDPRKRKGTQTVQEAVRLAKLREPQIILDTYYGKGIPQEKMAEKYSSALIFADGQIQAGWNNPVAEAMACKTPVVCTDIGGVEDIAINEKTALLVPPRNPKAMASSILRLIQDKNLRENLREKAYQHILQFDWEKTAEKLEKILISELTRPKLSNQSPKSKTLNLILDVLHGILNIGYGMTSPIRKLFKRREHT